MESKKTLSPAANCYKCNSNQELSLKARDRKGNPRTWICRPCRRVDFHKNKYNWTVMDRAEHRRILRAVEWSMLAELINGRIIKKWSSK